MGVGVGGRGKGRSGKEVGISEEWVSGRYKGRRRMGIG